MSFTILILFYLYDLNRYKQFEFREWRFQTDRIFVSIDINRNSNFLKFMEFIALAMFREVICI